MTRALSPRLDGRDANAVLAELLTRRPAYLPDFSPAPGQPAYALLQILARYTQAVIDRLNQAPEKNLVGFLDMMGISLVAPQPARAPVVFTPRTADRDTRIEAGVRLGADVPGTSDPVFFETETATAVAGGALSRIVTVWPAHDAYLDHTADLAGGRAIRLFQSSEPVSHALYLAHDTVLSFGASALIDVEFDLAEPGSLPLQLVWEVWDGQAWRLFVADDATAGLTRSGMVMLTAECAGSSKTTIDGVEAFWVRARSGAILPPDPSRRWAISARIRLRSRIDRPILPGQPGPVRPDAALASGDPLDLASTFYPFGKSPDADAPFYMACAEVLTKPGAYVTVQFTRMLTPEQEADDKGDDFEVKVAEARKLVEAAALDAAHAIHDAIYRIANLTNFAPPSLAQKLADLQTAINNVTGEDDAPNLADAADAVINATKGIAFGTGSIPQNATNFPWAAQAALDAATRAAAVLHSLKQLTPLKAAAAGGAPPPQLQQATLAWEYWDGRRWRPLAVSGSGVNLVGPNPDGTGTAAFTFVVPADLAPVDVDGDVRLWVRARIASGSYSRLRLVTWEDPQAKILRVLPIVEPRPPALKDLSLGYHYRSAWQVPEQTFALNDFRIEHHTADVGTVTAPFAPFRPIADALPALYLGFDAPLPNDLVSVYFNLDETSADLPPLTWEAHDGSQWQRLSVTDETEDLRHSGIVSFVAPPHMPRPQIRVKLASGSVISAASLRDAAQFKPGDRIEVRQNDAGEVKTVRAVDGPRLSLETPLVGTYAASTVTKALTERFGVARAWVRGRLAADGSPGVVGVQGLLPNATWASQFQTVEGEVLGSGNGQPNQTLFFGRPPIIEGETVEVLEFEGARAAIELPILRDELTSRGLTAGDLVRTVTDARTSLVTEVWVRWQARPHLFFSGPDDRHYVLERSGGRILFGDGTLGRLPAVGLNNIRATRYQTTLGAGGNVGVGKITRLLGGAALVQSVTNPVAAVGGAGTETIDRVIWRGPQVMRHQGRALAAADYEALAFEATAGVAAVKALPDTAANLRPAPGHVTLLLVPNSAEPQPQPPLDLRRRVQEFLVARAPATVVPCRIAVLGPVYFEVGVRAVLVPLQPAESGLVHDRVIAALAAFLHPAIGGPEGRGWPFGRDVFLSDVAMLLRTLGGVDALVDLELLVGGIAMGDRVHVRPDRVVAAGPLTVVIEVPEETACRCL